MIAHRNNVRITKASWLSYTDITKARNVLSACPDEAVKQEGLACLRGARPGYLMNMIPQDHPDRIAAAKWIMDNFS